MQVIWGGETVRSEPAPDIKLKYPEIIHSHSSSHWSTLDTMKLLVDNLFTQYVCPTMRNQHLDPTVTKWLLLWDVYSSHRSQPLFEYLKAKYPNLIILFVPANCTPVLQPLDVLFNATWKSFISNLCVLWLISKVSSQMKQGESASGLKLVTTKVAYVSLFF